MERAGYPPDAITSTLARLRDWRYVDDRAYASAFAVSAAERKKWGPARVVQALRRRRVGESLIEEAVAEAYPHGEEPALAAALARFRRTDRRRGTAVERQARAYRHLLGRGFSPGAIMNVLGAEKLIRETDPQ